MVWLGLGGSVGELVKLSQRVYSSMDELGFEPEDRAFSPHLTLGRVRRAKKAHEEPVKGAAELKVELAGLAGYRGPEFVADRVALFKSTLKPAGPIHQRLKAFELKG